MSDALSDGMPTPRERDIEEAKWQKIMSHLYIALLHPKEENSPLAITDDERVEWGMSAIEHNVTVFLHTNPKYYKLFKELYMRSFLPEDYKPELKVGRDPWGSD